MKNPFLGCWVTILAILWLSGMVYSCWEDGNKEQTTRRRYDTEYVPQGWEQKEVTKTIIIPKDSSSIDEALIEEIIDKYHN